jgi:hypothetical protein
MKLYFSNDRAWIGECAMDAHSFTEVPDEKDPRWIKGKPTIFDAQVLTLCHFYPSGRLGAVVEMKCSKPFSMYPNHQPFDGAVAWMLLSAVKQQWRSDGNENERSQ